MISLSTRHWSFLGLFVVVVVAMLSGFRPDIPVTSETRKLFDYIDSLPSGSVLVVSFDHEASALPEIRPLAQAVVRHAFRKGHRLIGLALMAEGTVIGYRLMEQTAREFDRTYGRDYVYLGFKPQNIATMLSMGESFSQTFPQDYFGAPYDQLDLMKGVNDYRQVAAVISITDGNMPTYWIEYAGARFGVRICSAMTAVMMTQFDPYVSSGQLYSLIGGLRGAAEYERLLAVGGGGARGMLAQSASHIYIIVLVIIGNVLYFRTGRKGRGTV
ncbi:MAG: hypothetical protein AB1644_08090 [Candidatus Zixiibacteriota bacterium]